MTPQSKRSCDMVLARDAFPSKIDLALQKHSLSCCISCWRTVQHDIVVDVALLPQFDNLCQHNPFIAPCADEAINCIDNNTTTNPTTIAATFLCSADSMIADRRFVAPIIKYVCIEYFCRKNKDMQSFTQWSLILLMKGFKYN